MSWLEEQYKKTQQITDGRAGGKGLGAFLWQQFVDEDKLNKEKQKAVNKQTAISLGEDIADLKGISESSSTLDVTGAAIKLQRERKKENKGKDLADHLEILTKGQAPQMAGIEAGLEESRNTNTRLIQQGKDQMDLTRLQMDQQNRDRGFDREMQFAQNNLTLQLGNMQADLADKRLQYDRETRSMDRRDQMIAQLMSGLGSLGGAFSL